MLLLDLFHVSSNLIPGVKNKPGSSRGCILTLVVKFDAKIAQISTGLDVPPKYKHKRSEVKISPGLRLEN